MSSMTTGTGSPGRPRRGQAKITEGHYPDIYQRWLKGASIRSLAAEYGVDWRTINHHLQKCRRMMRTIMLRDRNEVLDELTLVRAAAWDAFKKSQRPLTHDEVAKEVDRVAIERGVSPELASRLIKQTTRVTMRDGEATWLNVVLAAIDLEAKLCGHYETGKREGQKPAGKGSYRAAGRSPQEHHEAMAQRLIVLLSGQMASSMAAGVDGAAMHTVPTKTAMDDAIRGKTPARQGMPMAAVRASQGGSRGVSAVFKPTT